MLSGYDILVPASILKCFSFWIRSDHIGIRCQFSIIYVAINMPSSFNGDYSHI